MLKKDILFGSVVLLLAALFALTGCSQATDSDGGTAVYNENHLFGTANWQDVARAVASAKQSGRSVVLTDQLVIQGVLGSTTVADFGDLPVRVEGSVRINPVGGTNPVIVNAAYANISFAEDARITVEALGAFIYSGDGEHIYTNAANTGFKVKFVSNSLEGAQGTDARIAVANFKLGPDFSNVASHVSHLYVLDKVTIDASSRAPGAAALMPSVIALGDVDLTENNTAAFTSLTNFVFTADSVLTSSATGNVTISLTEPTAALPTVKATTPITITPVAGTITAFTINKIEGPETVSISATTTTALTINNVAADGKVAVTSPTITGGALTIGNAATGGSNAGSISVNAGTAFAGAVVIANNTGSIDLSTSATFAPTLTLAAPNRNTGSITITAPTIGTGAFAVGNNAGDFSLNASTTITSGVTVASNSGTINITSPSIGGTAVLTVTDNTGDILFNQDFTSTVADFLTVPANKGLINFKGTAGITGGITAGKIAGSGKVVFGGLATVPIATVIDCDTEFSAGLTKNTAGGITLGGNVTLGYEQAITLSTTTDILTLGANKRLLVGANPVLATGSAPVVITPGAGAVLTAGAELPGDLDDPETFVGYKTLTVGTAAIAVTSGNLRVPGVLNLGDPTGDLTVAGSLTIEDGGILAFANDAAGSGIIVTIGDTVIAGVNNAESRLTASGGPVTLAMNSISGSGSTLAVVPEMGSPVITVDPLQAGSKLLTIAGANLDLLGGGSLVINGYSGTENRVLLASGQNPGRITLGETTTNRLSNLAGKTLTGGAFNGKLGGNGEVFGDNIAFPTGVGYLSALEASNLTITGINNTGDNVTIVAGVSVTN